MVMREALLIYITWYGEEKCLDFKSFKILFQPEGNDTAEWEDVRFLDLAGLLNEGLTISDIGKCLKRIPTNIPEDLEALTLSNPSPKGKEKATAEVADSWEEEADDDTAGPDDSPTTSANMLPAQLTTPHFTNLSRLSLAHAGTCASWPDLLKLSPNLNKLTHLSLAYWPRPTLTPNAATTSMVSNYGRVSLGGTPFYSDLDDDFHEACNILRRFSINTYSLQWLDLEGCTWIKALTWHSASTPVYGYNVVTHAADTWNIHHTAPGPDWTDAWRRITYLNVFQGWIPADITSLQNMPAGVVPVQLMRWLRENSGDEEVRWKLNKRERGHAVAEWVDREKVARTVESEIQELRRGREGMWCRVDHGWEKVPGKRAPLPTSQE